MILTHFSISLMYRKLKSSRDCSGKWRSTFSPSVKEPTLTPSPCLLHWERPGNTHSPGKWRSKEACAQQEKGCVAPVWTGVSFTGHCVVDLARLQVHWGEELELSVNEAWWEKVSRLGFPCEDRAYLWPLPYSRGAMRQAASDRLICHHDALPYMNPKQRVNEGEWISEPMSQRKPCLLDCFLKVSLTRTKTN